MDRLVLGRTGAGRSGVGVQNLMVPSACFQLGGVDFDEDVVLASGVAQLGVDRQGEGRERTGHVDAGEEGRSRCGAGQQNRQRADAVQHAEGDHPQLQRRLGTATGPKLKKL